nr:CII family transcriptional regulator [uncultured Erwinia sp.]
METANNSKLINQVETELRSRLTHKGQRVLAAEAGWHESKVSRLNLRDMATVFVLLEKVWETSLIAEVARQAVAAVMTKEKAPSCVNSFEA